MPPAPPPKDPKKESRDLARGMRPTLRPFLNAVVLNGILAISLIGFPWWRGRARAGMTMQAYVEYAACLHAGRVTDVPGLALPDGHRERFAALYVRAVPEWPAICRDALDRIAQDDSMFLLPGAKTGEEEVRAAAIGARSALDDLIAARASERPPQIPHRLLRTLDHLAAAVSVHLEETGIPVATSHLAFDLGDGPTLVDASRVPLQTASGGPLIVSARPSGLRAVAADSRSVAVVHVHHGTVEITQVRRPAAARAIIDDSQTTYLGWVTNEAACVHDEAHCARRLTGLARIRDGVQSPGQEVWIAAHPALPPTRSLTLDGGLLRVIGREADGTASARVFTLPEPWPDRGPTEGSVPEPVVAHTSIALGVVTDALTLGASTIAITADALTRDGVAIGAGSSGTLLACGARALLVDGARVRIVPRASDLVEAAPLVADIAPPLHAPEPLEDHARCAASGESVAFAWVDRSAALHLIADVESPRDQRLAEHIAAFAMTRTGDTIVFATWGEDGQRQVTLRRVWHDRVLSADIAAACWDDGVGLCGPAGLATEGSDTILYAREQSDLLVLRVTGSGLAPLPGLE